MRLVTWNWNGADRRDVAAGLRGDVNVYPEVASRVADEAGLRWIGTQVMRGLAVSAGPGFEVSAPIFVDLPRYVVPFNVEGPESFQLIAVWTQNDGRERYVRGLVKAVDVLSDWIASRPTVIMGDFNANACWDHEHPRSENYSALVERLSRLGLVSAYHEFSREEHGGETRPTFYLYRHEDRPYHLDYCFIPRGWLPRLRSVTVGEPEVWLEWSDHMPMVVEIE